MVDDDSRLKRKARTRILELRILMCFCYIAPFLLAYILENNALVSTLILAIWPAYKMSNLAEEIENIHRDLKQNRYIDPVFMELYVYRVESPIWEIIFFEK